MFPFIFDLCIVLKTECSDFLRGSGNSQPFSSLPQNFTFQGQTQNCERENLIGQYSGKCFEMVPDYVWCNLLYFPILLRNCVFDKNLQLLLSLFLFQIMNIFVFGWSFAILPNLVVCVCWTIYCEQYFAILSNKGQVCTLWSIEPGPAPCNFLF